MVIKKKKIVRRTKKPEPQTPASTPKVKKTRSTVQEVELSSMTDTKSKTKAKAKKGHMVGNASSVVTIGSEAQREMKLAPIVDKNVQDMRINTYTDGALFRYGSYVVQDRAVPELRDGLKPSHRAMLWSAFERGLWPSGAFQKSAAVVGHAIGEYHPHGDKACYDAGVSIANFNPPLLWGEGNFGTPVDQAAAQRYSEMKLSRFAYSFLVDRRYLEAVPYHMNFSETRPWPIYMPALLPMLLLAGNPTIPAYGVRSGNPSFELRGVANLTIAGLGGRELTVRDMHKHLKIQHPYGAECVASTEQMDVLFKTGRVSIPFRPQMISDLKRKVIVIQSYSPKVLSNGGKVDETLRAIAAIKGVSSAMDSSGKKNKDSGPYGCALTITVGRGVGEDEFYSIGQAIRKKLTATESYQLGVTIRSKVAVAQFKHASVPQFFNSWIKYRIGLEVDYLNVFTAKAEAALHLVNGKLIVVANKDSLDKAIHLIRTATDPKAALMKWFKLDDAQAESILSMQLRSLAKLVLDDLKKTKAELVAEIKGYNLRMKDPGKSAAEDLRQRLKAYLAKPDVTVSGVPVYSKE